MSQVDSNLIPVAKIHWTAEQRPPRRITTPASLMFDGTGQFHLEYATPRPARSTKQLILDYGRQIEHSRFMELLDFFGGPMRVTLAVGCALMLFGGTLHTAWGAGAVIGVGMLMVEAVVVIWAKSR